MLNNISFAESDFDAYQAKKWASNVYNLERLQVKQKLESLGKLLAPKLSDEDSPPLAWEVSIEHPAIWNNRKVTAQQLYFLRSVEAREEIQSRVSRGRAINSMLDDPSPYKEHVHLALSLNEKGIACGLTLYAEAYVDYQNLLKKLENGWERSKFHDLLSDIPSTFLLECAPYGDSGELISPPDIDPAKISGAFIEEKSRDRKIVIALRVYTFLERNDPRVFSPQLAETLLESFRAIMPLYKFIEWRRENDFMEVLKEIREHKKEQISKRLAPKSKVRITSGLWAGKKGIVENVDAKGKVKVLVGKITVQLNSGDVNVISSDK